MGATGATGVTGSTARTVEIVVDGGRVNVPEGVPLAAALFTVGVTRFRTSVGGEARSPICGMGICFECRVTIDGRAHQRSCLIPCTAGMVVETGGGGGGRSREEGTDDETRSPASRT